jgi:hypothetical protein
MPRPDPPAIPPRFEESHPASKDLYTCALYAIRSRRGCSSDSRRFDSHQPVWGSFLGSPEMGPCKCMRICMAQLEAAGAVDEAGHRRRWRTALYVHVVRPVVDVGVARYRGGDARMEQRGRSGLAFRRRAKRWRAGLSSGLLAAAEPRSADVQYPLNKERGRRRCVCDEADLARLGARHRHHSSGSRAVISLRGPRSLPSACLLGQCARRSGGRSAAARAGRHDADQCYTGRRAFLLRPKWALSRPCAEGTHFSESDMIKPRSRVKNLCTNGTRNQKVEAASQCRFCAPGDGSSAGPPRPRTKHQTCLAALRALSASAGQSFPRADAKIRTRASWVSARSGHSETVRLMGVGSVTCVASNRAGAVHVQVRHGPVRPCDARGAAPEPDMLPHQQREQAAVAGSSDQAANARAVRTSAMSNRPTNKQAAAMQMFSSALRGGLERAPPTSL